MLTQREIISTLEMLRNENLDVRTVTLGINLLDCAGSDLGQVRRRIAERLMRLAGQLVPVCDRVGQKYGIPVVNKRIAVSPIAAVAAGLSPAELVELARTLDAAARGIAFEYVVIVGPVSSQGEDDAPAIEADLWIARAALGTRIDQRPDRSGHQCDRLDRAAGPV